MQTTGPSSCQIPLALGILVLVAGAVFCFAGAFALGVGFFYFAESFETGHLAKATPFPDSQPTPLPPVTTPTVPATPFKSISPFKSFTPFKAITPHGTSGELDENGFPTARIHIGNQALDVELAETKEQQTKGLRFRQTLAENAGMLFIFSPPQRVSFWMKDASIPLSIAFIQSDGKIVQIRPMQPYDETPVPSLSDTVSYALMVNQGWFDRHGLSAGSVIEDLPR
jgi:uncharacterized membrane protein (UPF0127 family)